MFETQTAAKDELRRLKIKATNLGEAGLDLTDNLRLAAVECTKLLQPYGKTIYDATRHYLDYLEAGKSELTGELIKGYLQAKKRAGLSERHVEDIKYKLRCFDESFGSRPIKTLTAREIEDWLYTLGELSPQSLINYRAVLHAFFHQQLLEKVISANPIEAIHKPKHVQAAPAIFTPEEVTKLLAAAPDHLMAPLAIQAFAGLRTAEVLRLHWQDVKESIHVGARIAKTSRRRLVKILPNLAKWLACAPRGGMGPIWRTGFRSYHEAISLVCQQAGVQWQHNGLRHSYASYHLAEFENAESLALQMGHTSGRMVWDRYREVVPASSARRWWSIQPKHHPQNVVQMKGAA